MIASSTVWKTQSKPLETLRLQPRLTSENCVSTSHGQSTRSITARAAAHRSDVARMITLGLAKAPAGARLHGVAEEAVSTRDIAEAIGRTLDLPVASIATEDVPAHFGWIGGFFGMEMTATSAATRELLGWTPTGPKLIEDIDAGAYSAS